MGNGFGAHGVVGDWKALEIFLEGEAFQNSGELIIIQRISIENSSFKKLGIEGRGTPKAFAMAHL